MAEMNNERENGRRLLSGWRLLALTAVLCALSLILMLAALKATGPKTPVFTPPPFDPAAMAGTPQVPDGLGWQELDANAFRFSVCGVFAPENGAADLWLTNPGDSPAWLKLRVLDGDGTILGETGLLRPGEYVRSVALDPVPSPGDGVTLRVMAYEPESYHSAGSVDLNLTVEGETT